MIKKIILGCFLILSIASIAQEGTASPYSFYGIGDVRFKGAAENRFMGGISMVADSTHINLQNPASYSNLKYTTFTIGGSYKNVDLKDYSGTNKASRTNLDYLALAVPIGKKFGGSFGLAPVSSVGYKIKTINEDAQQVNRYQGTGGMNKVYFGLAYKPNKNWSFGADVNYNFGKIETKQIFAQAEVQLGTEYDNISNLSGVQFNFGTQFKQKITPKLELYSGLTFSPQANLKTNNASTLSSIVYSESFDPTIDYSNDTEYSTQTIKLPSTISFGVGIGQARKWMIGSEITAKQSNSYGNLFPTYSKATFENATKISVGGYYVPDFTSFSSYFKKITYRGGFRYENTGLVIANKSIKEQAVTGGMSLPLGGTFSNLNVGFEYGKRGTATANLVQENFFNVLLSLSINDLWFVKRKYD